MLTNHRGESNRLRYRIAELEAERDALKAEIAAGKKARGTVYKEVAWLRRLLRTCDGSHAASEEWRREVAAALPPAEAGEGE